MYEGVRIGDQAADPSCDSLVPAVRLAGVS